MAARAVGVTDPRVLEAIRYTTRAAFVPAAYVTRAYDDAPIPIPHHQVTTQPSLTGRIIAAPPARAVTAACPMRHQWSRKDRKRDPVRVSRLAL